MIAESYSQRLKILRKLISWSDLTQLLHAQDIRLLRNDQVTGLHAS